MIPCCRRMDPCKWPEQSHCQQMKDIYQAADTLYAMNEADEDTALWLFSPKMRNHSILKFVRMVERIAAILILPIIIFAAIQYYHFSAEKPWNGTVYHQSRNDRKHTPSPTVPSLVSIQVPLSFIQKSSAEMNAGQYQRRGIFQCCQGPESSIYRTHRQQMRISKSMAPTSMSKHTVMMIFVRTTLEEGSVVVRYPDCNGNWEERKIVPWRNGIILCKNHSMEEFKKRLMWMLSYHGKTVNSYSATLWQAMCLTALPNVTMHSLSSTINRMGNRFTGKIEQQRLDKILDSLSLMSNMHFKIHYRRQP